MKIFSLSMTLALMSVGAASALTVKGTVSGANVTPDLRVAGVVITPSGQFVQELSSVPVEGGSFTMEIPDTSPLPRAMVSLTPQNVNWPGVIDPVQVSGQAQVAELKLFTYRDQNNNGRRDDNEPLREAMSDARGANLFVVWANTDVTVTANKGFRAPLKRGWNAFLVDVGKAVSVQPFADSTVVTVRIGR
ncbi:hypothetical protein [Deinococcus sp. JMULE3]|uniref:hypothetical protein n=1 Tax=Deinococcus sp. JMULE3 TaxID=2518341 RepID=UPI001575EFB6|nr:hypothetical protein [Deinococcus sp. JMULE3]NTX99398.1 hypothetical protein [Deinococcus sp. JMULE3]